MPITLAESMYGKINSPSRHHSAVRAILRPQTPLVPLTAVTGPGTDEAHEATQFKKAGLGKLLSALGTVRKFANLRYQTVLAPTELLVKLDLPDFPVISIGRRGGFKIPDISTYPGAARPDSRSRHLTAGRRLMLVCLATCL
jgi:hypothetical protein